MLLTSQKQEAMSSVKEKMKQVINSQSEDASYDDILRELAFEKMVDRGMQDVRNNKTVSNEEMKQYIEKWQQ